MDVKIWLLNVLLFVLQKVVERWWCLYGKAKLIKFCKCLFTLVALYYCLLWSNMWIVFVQVVVVISFLFLAGNLLYLWCNSFIYSSYREVRSTLHKLSWHGSLLLCYWKYSCFFWCRSSKFVCNIFWLVLLI